MAGQIFEKVMKSRGPGKRQIKPAKSSVSLNDIPDYASTSSDDVDFKIDASELETSDSDSKEKQNDSESSSSQSSRSTAVVVAAESNSSESESESATPKKTGIAKKRTKASSPAKIRIKRELPAARSTVPKVQNRTKRSIQSTCSKRPCCVCLCSQEASSGAKPLLCTCCNLSVHAECYKLHAEARSGVGGWLCAVCEFERASGVAVCNRLGNVDCELCPANGGAYFACADTAGHFVHAVCALYTAGVRFVTEERASTGRRRRGSTESPSRPVGTHKQDSAPAVSLQDVTALRKSAVQRSCALCDDLRFSWTGAPIACDAGLCRAAFHATCAQRAGLLVELHTVHLRPRDASVTEPAADNVAYCRLHSNPEDVRRRRRAFVACTPYASIDEDFGRFAFLNVAPGFGRVTPVSISCRADDDAPRLLHSSAPLIKRFYRKAALLEHQLPTAALPTRTATEAHAGRGVCCVRKADLQVVASAQLLKANCAFSALPTFTPAFVERYFERNQLIAEEQERLIKAVEERRQLREQEIGLSDLYNTLVESAREERARTAQLCDVIYQLRSGVCGFSLDISDPVITDALDAQQVRTSRQVASKRPAAAKGDSRPVAAKQRRAAFDGASESESVTASVGPESGGSLFRACCVCSLMTGQHLLVQCDTCRLYYHLACLEPPLSRMPKKSRIYGWQCSRCTLRRACDSDDEKSGANVDVNQPRQLRHAQHAPNDADTDA